jgi:glycosyltransferase involved in cell wall biosynthesis
MPEHVQGGLEFHVEDLALGLAEKGCEVHLLTAPLPDPAKARYEKAGLIVHSSQCTGPSRYSLGYLQKIPKRIESICCDFQFDIIHGQEFALGFWKPQPGTPPLVLTVHGTITSETPLHRDVFPQLGMLHKIKAILRFGRRLIYQSSWTRQMKAAGRILVDSEFTLDELTLRHDVPRRKIRRIPLGKRGDDPGRPDYKSARKKLNWSRFQFLTIGRLEWQKGHEVAIEALAGLKEYPWEYTIAGSGTYESKLRRLIDRCGLNDRIRLVGRINGETKSLMLAGADLFLWPERTHPAFGLVGLESLEHGTPVLGTRRGGIPELLGELPHSRLILADPDDVESMRAKVLYLLDNTHIINDIREVLSPGNFRKNSYPEMVQATLETYHQLLDNTE